MITNLLLKLIRWWDYDFPILMRTEKGNWLGVADFKEGHTLIAGGYSPHAKYAEVYQNDYVTLMTALDNCVTVKTHPDEEDKK